MNARKLVSTALSAALVVSSLPAPAGAAVQTPQETHEAALTVQAQEQDYKARVPGMPQPFKIEKIVIDGQDTYKEGEFVNIYDDKAHKIEVVASYKSSKADTATYRRLSVCSLYKGTPPTVDDNADPEDAIDLQTGRSDYNLLHHEHIVPQDRLSVSGGKHVIALPPTRVRNKLTLEFNSDQVPSGKPLCILGEDYIGDRQNRNTGVTFMIPLPLKVTKMTEEDRKSLPRAFTFGSGNLSYTFPQSLPIVGGTTMTFGGAVVPFNFSLSDDGTRLATINLPSSNARLIEALANGNTAEEILKKAKDNRKAMVDSKKNFKASPITPIWHLAGFYRWNPKNPKRTAGMAHFSLGLQGSVQGQYFPITGEFTLKGLIGGKGSFDNSGGGAAGTLSTTGSLTAKLGVGLGVAYLGRVGAYGEGKLDVEAKLLPAAETGFASATLTGTLGAEVVALGYQLYSWVILKGSYPLVRKNPLKTSSEDEAAELGVGMANALSAEEDASELVAVPLPRAYLERESAWLGEQDVRVELPSHALETAADEQADEQKKGLPKAQTAPKLLQANTYPDAHVQLVETSARKVMVWLRDNASEGKANRSQLVWSTAPKGSDSWSAPQPVSDNGTADFEPSLFADASGNVHVAWLDAHEKLADGLTVQQTAVKMDVAYASLGSGASAFGKQEQVAPTASDAVRTSPKVAALDDKVVVGWSTYSPNNLKDLKGLHDVIMAKRQGNTWVQESLVKQASETITSLDAGVVDNQVGVAWTDDQDGKTVTTDDTKVFMVSFDGATKSASGGSNVKFANNGGARIVTWRGKWAGFKPASVGAAAEGGEAAGENGEALAEDEEREGCLWSWSSLNEGAEMVYGGGDLPALYDLDGDLATGALVSYPATEEDGTNLFGRRLANGSLGDEELLVEHVDDITTWDVTGSYAEPTVAFVAERGLGDEKVAEGDLCVADAGSLSRIQLLDCDVEGEVRPGGTVTLSALVDNASVDDLRGGITLRAYLNGTEVASRRVDTLAVNEELEVQAEFTLPNDFAYEAGRTLTVAACFGDSSDLSAASVMDIPFEGEACFDVDSSDELREDGEHVVFELRNTSAQAATGELVAIGVKEDGSAEELKRVSLGPLASNGTTQVDVAASGELFADDGYTYVSLQLENQTPGGEPVSLDGIETWDGIVAKDNDDPERTLDDVAVPSGWFMWDDGAWGYGDKDGNLVTGWLWDSGTQRWYYLDPEDFGAMRTGWLWDPVYGSWFYLNTNHDGLFGAMLTGWQFVDGAWYYLGRSSGRMKTGEVWVDGTRYVLAADGRWIG